MEINKLSTLFLLQKVRLNKQGKCPVRCRITYLKKRREFSVGLFVNPELWNSKKQKIESVHKEHKLLNTQLSLIKNNLNQAFLLLQINKQNFDVNDIFLQYKGENITDNKTLMEIFDLHNEKMKNLIGVSYAKSTFSKFIEAKKHVLSFLKFQYKKNDILLSTLKLKFLNDFDYYLKSEKNQKQITINKSIQRLRKIIKLALAEGYLVTDPFILYKPKRVVKNVVFLSTEELKALESHKFAQARLQEVRDWFVFSCYTGLAYNEIKKLRKQHIVKGFDGELWIEMKREKTQKNISIPLLPKARIMIDKYNVVSSNMVFDVCSNQKYNSYLKEIAIVVGINKKLSTHIARKTFASTVLLYNDVPIEIVSELLGHSSIRVTQESYGKVVQKKVSEQMLKLNNKLN
ncbi:site-specific integrase [Lutibacter sp. A80]|uniref:site-specific integrase n=1 Tax=Lutibacter sp. A80 TaxID=2918453 RepID=UPI001F06BC8A|nr:site-specific integrase [Lutibacter sp. A80]UMB59889.1 site-specific integrase [Lutibacter sp. A80]